MIQESGRFALAAIFQDIAVNQLKIFISARRTKNNLVRIEGPRLDLKLLL